MFPSVWSEALVPYVLLSSVFVSALVSLAVALLEAQVAILIRSLLAAITQMGRSLLVVTLFPNLHVRKSVKMALTGQRSHFLFFSFDSVAASPLFFFRFLLQDKHFTSAPYSVNPTEDVIMQELYLHGPAEATFTVYEDFLTYKSGVYQHVSGPEVGAHAVKIMV